MLYIIILKQYQQKKKQIETKNNIYKQGYLLKDFKISIFTIRAEKASRQ